MVADISEKWVMIWLSFIKRNVMEQYKRFQCLISMLFLGKKNIKLTTDNCEIDIHQIHGNIRVPGYLSYDRVSS